MFKCKDEIIINTPPEKIFYFLTHIDVLYHMWHPKDHVFCKKLKNNLGKEGSLFHFFEWVGKFPLYLIACTTKVEKNKYLEYEPAFPVSLFKLGFAYFKIEKVTKSKSKLIAFVQVGSQAKVIDKMLDILVTKLVGVDNIHGHIQEEGQNIKRYLE